MSIEIIRRVVGNIERKYYNIYDGKLNKTFLYIQLQREHESSKKNPTIMHV